MDKRTVYVAGMIAAAMFACGLSVVFGLTAAIDHCQTVAKNRLAIPLFDYQNIQKVQDACAGSERIGKSISEVLR